MMSIMFKASGAMADACLRILSLGVMGFQGPRFRV